MTAQAPDQITFREQRRRLHSNPLEQYWNDARPRPDMPAPHTACWRGYVATWQIEHDLLLLTDVDIPSLHHPASGLAWLFPDKPPPIIADWYSGSLRLPDGERLRYVHMGYATTYASETILEICDGQLVLIEEHDNRDQKLVKREVTARLDTLFGPDEAGFLRAIYLTPEDDATRLIYADWLDDRADPRASALRAFIATREQSELPETGAMQTSRLWWRLLAYRE